LDFSTDRPPQSPFDSNSENLASERLRRAIERNRAKQVKRGSGRVEPTQGNLFEEHSSKPSMGTRRGFARADNVEFTTDISVANPKPLVPINYVTAKRKVSARKKKATGLSTSNWLKKGTPLDYLVRAAWVFALILLGRLFFSEGGVIDYYQKKDVLSSKHHEYSLITQENISLIQELESIKSDQNYQRKLVRDHLGFIARDEFLLLFQSELGSPAI
jgi:cell division protein FtsB